MTQTIENLVSETVELTGAPPPEVLRADAPVLDARAIAEVSRDEDEPIYLVGLIGGKDVGKSSLVNALVGKEITKRTSFGEGTHTVIAYAHERAVEPLRGLLNREVPGRFSIVAHDVDALSRQVLLDLPDIDSHWQEHVQLTRRMLRHMLFPIWIQSVEKYADQQPQQLLQQVAQGNDPANFLFCLNKADQLVAREGAHAAAELRDDYARRLAGALKLGAEPRVHLISAIDPGAFDLPELKRTLSRQKSGDAVGRSVALAGTRRRRSLINWLEDQKLSDRAQRAQRMLREAEELTAARLAEPLLDEVVPRLTGDPSYRLSIVEPVTHARLSRWPIVNVIQTTLSPLMSLVRKSLTPASGANTDAPVDVRWLAERVKTTFAQLRQFDSSVAQHYANRKLWDDYPADAASNELSRAMSATLARQRELAMASIGRKRGFAEVVAAPVRWLLTIGAILWFPLVQPILERILLGNLRPTVHDIAVVIVPLLGSSYLLQSVSFLVIWFVALWMFLRWDASRRVNRLIERWDQAPPDSDASLAGACVRWIDDLLEPLRAHVDRASGLAKRVDELRKERKEDAA